jgi:hypothetical protein
MSSPDHTFFATAFVENFPLKEMAAHYPEAKRTPRELWFSPASGGTVFLYPFGALVFFDVGAEAREAELARLHRIRPNLTTAQVMDEQFTVREDPGVRPDVVNGVLTLDRLTFERASVVALTVAQSAAMDYYDRIVDQMFSGTDKLVDRLEKLGTVPLRTRHLHKFIGAAWERGTRCSPSCTCSTSPKPSGTTPARTTSTVSCVRSSTWSIATRPLNSNCAACRTRWS